MSLQLSDFPLQRVGTATLIPQIWSPTADATKNEQDKHGEENPYLSAAYLNQITCVFLDQIAII